MKGMGQIVTWSIVDETQHTDGMIELFKVFVEEYKTGNEPIRPDVLEKTVYGIAKEMVNLEEHFIDLVFKKYKDDPNEKTTDESYTNENLGNKEDLNENLGNKDFFGLTPKRLKAYIKYIADRRLNAMGYESIFNIQENPLPELEVMINAPTHTNFFENRATDYANVSTTGTWSQVWNGE